MRSSVVGCFALAVLGIGISESRAEVYMTRAEALQVAFGNARVERETVFLTDDQMERVRSLAGDGVEIRGALVTQYVGTANQAHVGTAYFDTHRVRTLQETIMVVVSPEGTVERVEILSFLEPREYLPRDKWLQQFDGRALDSDLTLKKAIHGITGATLSARAVTEATRRILALHRTLSAEQAPANGAERAAP